MNCKYYLKGRKSPFETIEELYNFLTPKKLDEYTDIVDIIFSKEALSNLVEALKRIRNEAKEKAIDKYKDSLILSEDTIFEGLNNEMSIISFLDNSGEAMLNGSRVITPLNEENYKILEKYFLMETCNKSEEEANNIINTLVNNWKLTADLGKDLHKLIISKYIGSGNDSNEEERKELFIKQAKEIVGTSSILNNDKLLGKLFTLMNDWYKKTKSSNLEVIRGINITSLLRNSSTKLFGHIDYAIVGEEGKLHIYNFKISSLETLFWSPKKWEKYALELTFIKLMLSNNNLNISGIEMHIVPINLEYNGENLKSISVRDAIDYEKGAKSGKYKNEGYDYIARYFIDSGDSIINISSEQEKHIDNICEAVFPSMQIRGDNIRRTALEWIKRAPSFGEEEPLIIREVNDDTSRYKVFIFGKPYSIGSHKEKTRNKEIIDLVEKHIEKLNLNHSDYAEKVAKAILKTFKRGLSSWDFSNLRVGIGYLESALALYISGKSMELDDGKEVFMYDWEFNDSLISKNILLFRNRLTHLVDIITLSSKDLYQIPRYRYGDNILGGYVTDKDFIWKGDFGNVETVRSMIILNEFLPTLYNNEEYTLGNIKIISSMSMGRSYNIEHIYKDYLNPIFKVVRNNNKDLTITDNFKSTLYTDPIELLVKELNSIFDTNPYSTTASQLKALINDDELVLLKTREQKRAHLLNLLQRLEETYPNYLDLAHILDNLNATNPTTKAIARIYKLASDAFHYYSGENPTYEHTLESMYKFISTAPTVPDANINAVVNVILVAINQTSDQANEEYDTNIRKLIKTYYDEVGYTSLQNMTIGNLTYLFKNMYQTDSEGNMLMLFKNPYINVGDTYYLTDPERKFLKKALFLFNKYNFRGNDKKGFTSENDPRIAEYIENSPDGEQYLWVPLERASDSSRRQQGIDGLVRRTKRWFQLIFTSNGREELFDEAVNNMTLEERQFMEDGLVLFKFNDPFLRDYKSRRKYIEKQGVHYFETNVENLLIDRMYQSINTEKINEALTVAKSFLLLLKLLGDNEYTKKIIDLETKYIEDYLKVNVFKKSIMEPTSLKIVGALSEVRKGVIFMNLAGNLIAGVRDIENGFFENYLRTATKYLTSISAKTLTSAYKYVIKESSFDALKITLLGKLCAKYRLSNVDTAKIVERLKSNRQGAANWDNVAFSTLRGPDFLNRMTLFIAQAMLDGILNEDGTGAWEIKDDELVYNWKKDKRFSIYAQGESMKNHPEYAKQKGLYRLKIREWNMDHPKGIVDKDGNRRLLEFTDDLPTPYSNLEIIAIKLVADNIYGAYDKSIKAMGENLALGWAFAMYTTWMNGMWNNWTMKPGIYNINKMNIELETDLEGNLLFEDDFNRIYVQHKLEDGTVEYVYEETGEKVSGENLSPLLKKVPIITCGVIPILKQASRIFKDHENGGFKAAYKYIMADERTKVVMELAASSLGITFLMFFLFLFVLDPTYKELKKAFKGLSKIAMFMTDMTFRPLKPALDSLAGPINIIKYLGEQMDPPIYHVPIKASRDLGKTIFGNKTFNQFLTGNFALFRAFKNVF